MINGRECTGQAAYQAACLCYFSHGTNFVCLFSFEKDTGQRIVVILTQRKFTSRFAHAHDGGQSFYPRYDHVYACPCRRLTHKPDVTL